MASILRPGFVHSRAGAIAIFATLAGALAGLFTDYWRITSLPLVAVAIYALLSGDEHLPRAEGDQQQRQSIEKES